MLFLLAEPTAASADDFYKGKVLKVDITSGVGGGPDVSARLTGRYLSKYIPGNPTVVYENTAAAGGIVGANYMFNQAPRDGTVIAASLDTTIFQELFFGPRSVAKFDARQFNYLGSPSKFVLVSIAWHTSAIKKWQDLLDHELIVGSGGPGSNGTIDALILKNVLGFKYHLILGYQTGHDSDLAMVRGEIEGRASILWEIIDRNPDWLTDKKINVLFQYGLEKDPRIPADVPLLMNQIKDNDQREVLKLRMAADDLGLPFFAPPGVPPDRIAILRRAYEQVFKDPDFLADAAKEQQNISPVSGERQQQIVNDAFNAADEYKERLQRASMTSGQFDQVKSMGAAPSAESP